MCRRRKSIRNAPPLRPTLFIGLGGCGSKVLRRLRRRLDDRLPRRAANARADAAASTPTPASWPCAAHGDELGHLRPEETLAMPLRRSQDYREDSRQILEWLSRRWLYNIPRSLQTEGCGRWAGWRWSITPHAGDGAAEAGDRKAAPGRHASCSSFRGS